MKVRVKAKYTAGAAVTYITRRQALKKLQLSLKDFRRLCILKGIYPHEPTHKKRANKGSTASSIFYYRKDINFLAFEPIINKFREYKTFLKRLNHYKAKDEESKLKKLYENKPEYESELDRVVKERYPTFGSAIRDLDDALCLCFAFATFPHTRILKQDLIDKCKRLTAEFMHYVIESRSLRNVFVSIKGIYYQAEVCGEKVTWIVPHDRGLPHITDVDFGVMVTFAEFYVAMLGFVNFRLYQMVGLYYPPQIQTGQNVVENADDTEEHIEKIYSLAKPLARRADVDAAEEEQMDMFGDDENNLAEKLSEINIIKNLFKGCVFLLNREVPREALTLIIRNSGGTVGWINGPNHLHEDSSYVTHQIVDRPVSNVNVSRTYVQPQWVFDSLNARRKLPTGKYMPGSTLPPHFSPFAKENPGDYVSLERLEELRSLGKDVTDLVDNAPIDTQKPKLKKPKKVEQPIAGMHVKLGKMHKINKQSEINEQGAQNKIREMMISKKHKPVYHSMKKQMKRNRNDALKLKTKREKKSVTDL